MAFENVVTQARKSKSSKVLTNRSISHARHVIREMLEFGLEHEETVNIVSGSLNDECYSTISDIVPKFNDKEILIHVWVTDVPAENITNSFTNAIRESDTATLNDFPNTSKIAPHFVVVGEQAYRLETDHKSAKAILCFNDPSLAATLKRLVQTVSSH